MPRLTDTAPNRVLTHEIITISDDPFISVVSFETDEGTVELAFNRAGAEAFLQDMRSMLDAAKD
jgi:hypothetical protein